MHDLEDFFARSGKGVPTDARHGPPWRGREGLP